MKPPVIIAHGDPSLLLILMSIAFAALALIGGVVAWFAWIASL
ncbi:MAG TPA: hypothetical protein VG897_14160 [Terriglobales bacterium]|nr:hypothetical protein [Terriglobales bacterium]